MSESLSGKGAFSRFKRVLENYPKEREQWYKFKDEAMKAYIKNWLEEEDIEAE